MTPVARRGAAGRAAPDRHPGLRALLALAISALGGGLNGGCSALVPRLEAPQLKVVGLDFLGGDRQQQQLRLHLQVTNPNSRPIAVRAIDYRVAIADTDFAQGSSVEPFTVPALGQGEFDLDVATDFGALLRVLGAHLGDAALDYRVTGRVHLAEGLLRELPFTGHGQLALH